MPTVNHSIVVKPYGDRMLWAIVLVYFLTGLVAFGQVNSWTKPTSGAWEEPVWSLGILPNSSQTIEFTNAGFKAIGINPATVSGFPGSLTINHLDVFAPANSSNTLLLNFIGTNVPLQVLNGVNVGTNGRILNLFAGLLVVNAGHLAITNGSVQQDGGFVSVGDEIDVSGSYNLTNGLVQTPSLLVVGGSSSPGLFTQDGGTNSISDLELEGVLTPANYELGGGLLSAGSEEIFSGRFALATFTQTGGSNTVTNTLRLQGFAINRDPFSPFVALYILNGGQLSVANLGLDPYGSFAQSNGNATVSGAVEFNAANAFFRTTSFLAGGTLATANVSFGGAGGNLVQTGGTLTVSNLFSFGGFVFEPPLGFAFYDFAGGLLMASNIEILGNFSIDSAGGQTRRITNPGFFRLGAGGTVTTATINEQLGSFILASSAAIDMSGGNGKLAFADSSSQTWAAGAILSVLNWSGSTNGGGSDQLFFGTNAGGLTLTQLAEIQFVNPAGFPPGTNFASILSTGEVVPSATPAVAQVNSWTKPTSGAWEEPVWSLGILPDSSQNIEITNAGFKAVGINPATATGFPGSLTINHLDIFGPANSSNTLLMNFFGTNPPLRVVNGVNVGTNGRILNLSSGLLVNAGHLAITNGSVAQDGGFVTVGDEIDMDGSYNLTNGFVQTPELLVGGGVGQGLFTQVGGTNSISDLALRAASAPASYNLSGGLLSAGSEEIFSGGHNALATFTQTGGGNTVTNALRLQGSAISSDPFGPSVALYSMNSGQLSVGTLLLDSYSSFAQSNGTTMVSGAVDFNTGSPFFLTTSFLTGGTLATANVGFAGAGEGLEQTGGTLVVSNLLSFGGFTFEPPLGFALYDFAGGLLMASNIEILANFSIGSAGGQTRRITNPGFFRLGGGGTVTTATINEQLGHFILASSAMIDMSGGAGKLAFANSSSQAWTAGAILSVLNWSGSTNGGGSDQLFFGTNAGGLTSAQLAQIQFINPAGFPPGTNFARILNTGEVVPSVQPVLFTAKQGAMTVLEWSGSFTLLSATNVLGPYSVVPGAVSPFVINTSGSPMRFFRLVN